MEEMMYLSVRLGCAVYLLYKVWGQKARIREWCDLLYTPVKRRRRSLPFPVMNRM